MQSLVAFRKTLSWILPLLFLTVRAQAGELPIVPPAEAGLSAEKLKAVDEFLERQVSSRKIAGGIVVVSHSGKVGVFRTYGKADLEADKPMTPETIFRLYSMTKAITTAAALTLVDSGKIGLEDPVSKYIPSFSTLKVAGKEGLRDPARAMTVRDLMLHTAGLSYGNGPDAHKEAYAKVKPMEAANLEQMCERLAKVPLAYDPGSDWLYSVSIDVLGRVIEVASGETLDVYLKKTIFDPLDMKDTGFSVPSDKLPRFAANYSRATDGLKLIDPPATSKFAKPATLLSGGGGLVGTARDYLRFLTMVMNGGELDGKRVLSAAMAKRMVTNELPERAYPIRFGDQVRKGVGFGLGFSVRTEQTEWDPAGHVGEFGWGGAASTHYWCSPEDKLIVITLEQIMPYQWDTEFGVKKLIYDSIEK